MIRATMEASAFAMELTLCNRGCGALLTRYDFKTDWLGRTVEACPKCGPQLLPVKRSAPRHNERPVRQLRVVGKCRCGAAMVWSGLGHAPVRCCVCQKKERQRLNREYQRECRSGLRTVVPRRFSA